jgi:hypothetical protein
MANPPAPSAARKLCGLKDDSLLLSISQPLFDHRQENLTTMLTGASMGDMILRNSPRKPKGVSPDLRLNRGDFEIPLVKNNL